MSQREKRGFNWHRTGAPIGALDEAGSSPTACSFSGRLLRSIVASEARPSRQSRVVGVAQPAANLAASTKVVPLALPRLRVAVAFAVSRESATVAVGHPDNISGTA